MARAYRGWSQTKLAKRAGVHNMQISKLERGVIRETSTGTLRALCRALGVSPAYLLGLSDAMEVHDVEEEPAHA
jgi:transcriptional regulator with XRE-family HTH domain